MQLNKYPMEKQIALVAMVNKLVAKGYQAKVEFSHHGISFYIFNAPGNLVELKKLLGVKKIRKSTYSDKSSMKGKTTLNGVDITIFPKDNVFTGCRIVEKEVTIPRKVVAEHTEIVKEVVCGNGGGK